MNNFGPTIRTTTSTSTIRKFPRLPLIVLVVVVVVLVCFPHQQSEDDDDHEHDQENHSSSRLSFSSSSSCRLLSPPAEPRTTTSTSTIRRITSLPIIVFVCFPHRQSKDNEHEHEHEHEHEDDRTIRLLPRPGSLPISGLRVGSAPIPPSGRRALPLWRAVFGAGFPPDANPVHAWRKVRDRQTQIPGAQPHPLQN